MKSLNTKNDDGYHIITRFSSFITSVVVPIFPRSSYKNTSEEVSYSLTFPPLSA